MKNFLKLIDIRRYLIFEYIFQQLNHKQREQSGIQMHRVGK